MDEFAFINNVKQNTYRQPSVRKGIGDDAAVFRQSSEDIVTAKDMLVEGVHFSRKTMRAFHIGYRALAANISDIAAMGARPAFYLVAIAAPDTWSYEALNEVYDGMKEIARCYNMDLLGGDTVSGSELTISVTIIGFVHPKRIRYRSLAKDGDIVFATGNLGDSQAGFYLLTSSGYYQNKDCLINRHQMPYPRVEFAQAINEIKRVCLNDISDGLANEANEIVEASNVGLVLEQEHIPINPSLNQFTQDQQEQWVFFGGEDFELVGTVAEENWPMIEKAAEMTNTKVTKIGYVTSASQGKVLLKKSEHKMVCLEKKGYNHFSK